VVACSNGKTDLTRITEVKLPRSAMEALGKRQGYGLLAHSLWPHKEIGMMQPVALQTSPEIFQLPLVPDNVRERHIE